MKKVISTILFLSLTLVVTAQYTLIPDPNFEQALIDYGYDSTPIDGRVETSAIIEIEALYLSNRNISNLTGIEDFENLRTLVCRNNSLTSLNLQNCEKLEVLQCNNNDLTDLNLSTCESLIELNCANNHLQSLNLHNNIKIKQLKCGGNNLSEIDLSQNPLLEIVSCRSNNLQSLSLEQNNQLIHLDCSYNDISNLDLTHNFLLENVQCSDNKLAALDLENNRVLRTLAANHNELMSINLTTCDLIGQLYINNNFLVEVDLKSNEKLHWFICDDNLLTSLDLSNNTELGRLSADRNNLSFVNLKNRVIGIWLNARENNSNLCVEVDDPNAAASGDFPYQGWDFGDRVAYSENCNDVLSTDETALERSVKIYQTNSGTLHIENTPVGNIKLQLYNTVGQKLIEKEFFSYRDLDLRIPPNIRNGIFIVHLQTEKGSMSKKVLLR